MIIEKPFADVYGFNAQNAIIYTDSLASAFKQIFTMSAAEYLQMQSHLKKLRAHIYAKSLTNLQHSVSPNSGAGFLVRQK
jgi:hypothetical protein